MIRKRQISTLPSLSTQQHLANRNPTLYLHTMQQFRIALAALVLFFTATFLQGQNAPDMEKYWIFFTDKGDVSHYQPTDLLTERALQRRAKHGIAIDYRDYPVSAAYRQVLRATPSNPAGFIERHPSKWFNALSVWMDARTRAEVEALPFVKEIKAIPKAYRDLDATEPINNRIGYNAGYTASQLEMIGLDDLHQNGYNGRGILISVMDNGFNKVDQNPWLQHLINDGRLVATHDFVNDEENVFNQGNHGAWVLSILAGWYEDPVNEEANFYGSAHGASFILCHTENDLSETTQEEDNWVAAMEFADSLGADIFSTSLGYRDFDGGFDYGYAGMDGNTTIITRGADIAASRGIVVVNSAGNAGSGKLLAPSDGDSVISVGAVNAERGIAGFSSHGPSADNRIKPDVCAMGDQASFITTAGTFARGNGTSFSCPVMSGFLACLLQAAPETKNMDLYEALIRSGDHYDNPDELYGYGIPDAATVYHTLTGQGLKGVPSEETLVEEGMVIYPNPATDRFQLVIDNGETAYPATLSMFDTRGRKVWEKEIMVAPFYNVLKFNRAADYPSLSSGRYTLRLQASDDSPVGETSLTGRISIVE